MANKIRSIRENKHISQSELARRLNISRTHLNRIENGKVNSSLALLERIANELGVSMKDFF